MKKALVYSDQMAEILRLHRGTILVVIQQDFETEAGHHPEFDFIIFPIYHTLGTYGIYCREQIEARRLALDLKDATVQGLNMLFSGRELKGLQAGMRQSFPNLVFETYEMVPSHPKKENRLLGAVLRLLHEACADTDSKASRPRIHALADALQTANFTDADAIMAIREAAEQAKTAYADDPAVFTRMSTLLNAYPKPDA